MTDSAAQIPMKVTQMTEAEVSDVCVIPNKCLFPHANIYINLTIISEVNVPFFPLPDQEYAYYAFY